jgi:hypothetical protein
MENPGVARRQNGYEQRLGGNESRDQALNKDPESGVATYRLTRAGSGWKLSGVVYLRCNENCRMMTFAITRQRSVLE